MAGSDGRSAEPQDVGGGGGGTDPDLVAQLAVESKECRDSIAELRARLDQEIGDILKKLKTDEQHMESSAVLQKLGEQLPCQEATATDGGGYTTMSAMPSPEQKQLQLHEVSARAEEAKVAADAVAAEDFR